MEAKASGVRLGQRITFVPRLIGGTEIAAGISTKSAAGIRRAA
jgi:hypothetical protein